MKKILWIVAVWVLLTSVCFWNWDSSGGYNAPINYEKLSLNAYLDWSKVVVKWTPIEKSITDQEFKYYKVVKSKSNPSPVYPDDGYIHYTSELSASSYEDYKLENGINYYRVCAIFSSDRYCSNVVKLEINKTWEYKETPKKEQKKEYNYEKPKTQTNLNEQTKNKLNNIISNFANKLKTKLDTDVQRVQVIDNVLAKLRAYKWLSVNQKMMQTYLISKLENLRSSYDDGTSELESLFNF